MTTIRHAANDRGFFQVGGVQPEREPLLVIKSRGHFRADFEPICRAIIEAHNGRLWFSPNTPRGAVFQFTLHGTKSAAAGG